MSAPDETPLPETGSNAVTPMSGAASELANSRTRLLEYLFRRARPLVEHLSDLAVVLAVIPKGSRMRQILLKLLRENPGLNDVVASLGQSYDPYPVSYRSTFIADDQLALAEDRLVVSRDIRMAQGRADELL